MVDSDSLVYISDSEFTYGEDIPKSVIDDIENKEMMVYGGYYHFEKGWDSPKIYLLCRGKRTGKFKLKIEGFLPYCYNYSEEGEYKTYLSETCEKIILKGQHPANIKVFRERLKSSGHPQPLEADILFVRRFLIDTYNYFKPKEKINPIYAIVDIETNYPDSNDIVSFAINNPNGYTYYESKHDTSDYEELVTSLYNKLQEFDVILAWMGEDSFDLKIMDEAFKKIGFPPLTESVVVLDLIEISRKMHGREIRGNWSLDNAGKRLCGIAKSLDEKDMEMDIRDLPEEKLFVYNTIDTIIPEVIDEFLGGLEGHVILAWSLQAMLDDMIVVAAVNDIALLRAYHKEGIVLPSREFSKGKSTARRYEAAKPDARPGVYENIVALDLIHAYPSAVIAKNISPETKDKNGIHITPKGTRFNDGKSVFIETLKDLMVERATVKKQLKKLEKDHPDYKKLKSIDFALKTQIAAFSHGIFGWANSRMKDTETADAITAVVREIINKVKETCDIIGKPWCYCHSVVPNTPILIINKFSGLIETREIQDITSDFDEYMVWSDNKWTNIEKVIKHRRDSDIYRVNTRKGLVDVTDYHSLLSIDGKEVKPIDLKIGDKLLHKKFDSKQGIALNKNLAWLLGLFVAEGSCGKYNTRYGIKYQWKIDNLDKSLLEGAKYKLKQLGYDSKILDIQKSSSVYRLVPMKSDIINTPIKDLMNLFSSSYNESGLKKVPSVILNSDKDTILEFLRGFNAGDGSHDNRFKSEFQRFTTKSKEEALGLCYLLDVIGFDYNIRQKDNGIHKEFIDIVICTQRDTKIGRNLIKPNETIKCIEKIESNCEWVYDLETENHHFQAGVGNMIVHNTDSAYVICKKEEARITVEYINKVIRNFCEGYKIIPELEFKGYYPIGYIHSPARNVLIPEGISIDDDENWEETGMNYARSETPTPLANIEIELLKMKLKHCTCSTMISKLKEMIKELSKINSTELALVKPLNKKVSEYGKIKKDGTIGNIPFHITAMVRANKEYGLELKLKTKYGILPIMTNEFIGVRKKRRKRVDIAFNLDDGLPKQYQIDFLTYLDGNLFGKINDLFGLKVKELKELIIDDEVRQRLGINE